MRVWRVSNGVASVNKMRRALIAKLNHDISKYRSTPRGEAAKSVARKLIVWAKQYPAR
jgi:hypothetical protein